MRREAGIAIAGTRREPSFCFAHIFEHEIYMAYDTAWRARR